ncbi:hypothetical protein VNO78_15715 [Psophocarpus tetragonolobus]|uniref:Uncharacterized protein n=1 Tax=Psophocarpus tetragonolobus TaxID=3891 RepID=A0AAN9SEJ8_PSOTE
MRYNFVYSGSNVPREAIMLLNFKPPLSRLIQNHVKRFNIKYASRLSSYNMKCNSGKQFFGIDINISSCELTLISQAESFFNLSLMYNFPEPQTLGGFSL